MTQLYLKLIPGETMPDQMLRKAMCRIASSRIACIIPKMTPWKDEEFNVLQDLPRIISGTWWTSFRQWTHDSVVRTMAAFLLASGSLTQPWVVIAECVSVKVKTQVAGIFKLCKFVTARIESKTFLFHSFCFIDKKQLQHEHINLFSWCIYKRQTCCVGSELKFTGKSFT